MVMIATPQPRRIRDGAVFCAGRKSASVAQACSLLICVIGSGCSSYEPDAALPDDIEVFSPVAQSAAAQPRDEPVLPGPVALNAEVDRELTAPLPSLHRDAFATTVNRSGPAPRNVQQDFNQLIEAGQFDEARGILRKALRERPDDPQLLYLMAFAHFVEGKLNRAEPVLNRVLRADPQHAEARKLLTAVLTAQGRCAVATEEIDKVLAELPDDAEAQMLRAAARLRCGDWIEAETDADAALRLDPSSDRALLIRCTARLRKGDVEAAREDFRAARLAGAPDSQLQLLESQLAGEAGQPGP